MRHFIQEGNILISWACSYTFCNTLWSIHIVFYLYIILSSAMNINYWHQNKTYFRHYSHTKNKVYCCILCISRRISSVVHDKTTLEDTKHGGFQICYFTKKVFRKEKLQSVFGSCHNLLAWLYFPSWVTTDIRAE